MPQELSWVLPQLHPKLCPLRLGPLVGGALSCQGLPWGLVDPLNSLGRVSSLGFYWAQGFPWVPWSPWDPQGAVPCTPSTASAPFARTTPSTSQKLMLAGYQLHCVRARAKPTLWYPVFIKMRMSFVALRAPSAQARLGTYPKFWIWGSISLHRFCNLCFFGKP